MSRRSVAVVSDGVLGAVAPLAEQIRAIGARPVLITGPPSPGRLESWSELYDEVVVLADPTDPAALAQAAVGAANRSSLVGLFSCFDGLCLPAAEAAHNLGLPHPALPGLARARDKSATRKVLERWHVPSVPAIRLTSSRDLAAAGQAIGYPAVIKPVDGTASHFVRRVDGLGELESAYEEGTRHLVDSWPALHHRQRATAGSHAFLLERYLTGNEYCLDAVVTDGQVRRVAAFDKFIVDQNGFLECAFAAPFLRGSRQLAEELWDYVELCLQAVGVDDTLVHTEVMLTTDGPRLIEINAGRPCGQILPRAIHDTTGVDLLAELIALQTGGPPPGLRAPVIDSQVATYTVFPAQSGRVAALSGLEALRQHPPVVDVIPYCAVGDWIDTDNREFFALNVLTAGLRADELVPFYDVIRCTIDVVIDI